MQNVLVLGGTGAMGHHLVNILSEMTGVECTVTSRSSRQSYGNVRYVRGNAHDREFFQALLLSRNWDVVVDFMVYGTGELKSRLSDILSAAGQYMFLSSARVFAGSDGFLTEMSPRLMDVSDDKEYLSTDEYALAKAREENLLRNSGKNNWTIIRPYITFGEQRLQLGVYEKEQWLNRVLDGRSILFSEDIACHYTTMTYGCDVAYGIAGLIGNPRALGEDFNITTSEFHKWSEILGTYLDVLEESLGKRPKVIHTPSALNLRLRRMQYQVKYCRLYDRRFDNSKILSAVPGLKFRSTLDGLREATRQYLQSPHVGRGNLIMDALMDRKTGDIMRKSDFESNQRYLKYLLARYTPSVIIEKYLNR